jgi:hypothetical protein
MEKRARSPSYPAISLPDAIEKLSKLFVEFQTHPAPRNVVARGMGYAGLSGPAASAISALSKYGLLERHGDDLRISERGMSILHPHEPSERAGAIGEAAVGPKLFAELRERFPGAAPSQDLLRNYLVRKGFLPSAVKAVVLSYRETCDFAAREGAHGVEARPASLERVEPSTEERARAHDTPHRPLVASTPAGQSERSLGRYDFEGGGIVRITVSGPVETERALDMVEILVRLKRQELEQSNDRATQKRPLEPEDRGTID